MRNIAFQLGLQQCCKTSSTFLVARFTEALVLFCKFFFGVQTSVFIQNYVDFGRLSRYHHSFCPGMEFFLLLNIKH